MCGRTACSLAPDDLVKACTYKDRTGNKRCPVWRDAPGGQQYSTSYNVAPTSHCPVLISGRQLSDESPDSRVLMPMKWGLTPSWHKDDPYKVPFETNNCRVEGMLEKKTYKVPLSKGHRCVVVMDGFFEWKTSKDGKQPYFFHFPQSKDFSFSKSYHTPLKTEVFDDLSESEQKRIKKETDDIKDKTISSTNNNLKPFHEQKKSLKESNSNNEDNNLMKSETNYNTENKKRKLDEVEGAKGELKAVNENDWTGQRLLSVAGVYDIWQSSPSSAPLYSYSVITVPASEDFSWCHHRMPAVLTSEEEIDKWLDSSSIPLKQASDLIRPTKCLTFYPVTKSVGNSRYKESDCVQPIVIGKPKPSASSNFMTSWLKKEKSMKKE